MSIGSAYHYESDGSRQFTLHWRHNDHDGVSNHQPRGCLLNRLFGRRSKKTSKPRVTGLCEGNSPVTGEFPAQRASNAENVSIWWRHHEIGSSDVFVHVVVTVAVVVIICVLPPERIVIKFNTKSTPYNTEQNPLKTWSEDIKKMLQKF